jgi:Tfp pilus assembly PilM family ATPase
MKQKIEELLNQRKTELQQKINLYNQLEEQQRVLIQEIVLLQGGIKELEELQKMIMEQESKDKDKEKQK